MRFFFEGGSIAGVRFALMIRRGSSTLCYDAQEIDVPEGIIYDVDVKLQLLIESSILSNLEGESINA
jgi:hypothetical protein